MTVRNGLSVNNGSRVHSRGRSGGSGDADGAAFLAAKFHHPLGVGRAFTGGSPLLARCVVSFHGVGVADVLGIEVELGGVLIDTSGL